MAQYCVDDFSPSDAKVCGRVRLVRAAAGIAAKTYLEIAERDYGLKGAIVIRDDHYEPFIREYFSRVARFKIRHGYDPGERINQPKIAALLLATLAEREPTYFFRSMCDTAERRFYGKAFP